MTPGAQGALELHVTEQAPLGTAVLPGWFCAQAKALALILYLEAPCGHGRMPTTQPGPQTSSISSSSRLLGQQPGQILNKEADREAAWVINGEQELR